jgi:phytanoyl-CoA hydroxylase
MTGSDPEKVSEEFLRNGYSIVEGLFSPAEVTAIRALAERLPGHLSGDYMPAMNPHKQVPELLDVMGDERLLRIMRRLMKGTPQGLQTQYFFCQPGTRGFSAHQDNHYVQAPSDRFASAWLALDDVEPSNGALIVLPGSHEEPILDVRPIDQPSTFGQDPNHNRQECVVTRQYTPVDATVRAGGVVFLHSHVVHWSHHNVSTDRFRRALLMTYLSEGAPFRAGFIAKREPFRIGENRTSGSALGGAA